MLGKTYSIDKPLGGDVDSQRSERVESISRGPYALSRDSFHADDELMHVTLLGGELVSLGRRKIIAHRVLGHQLEPTLRIDDEEGMLTCLSLSVIVLEVIAIISLSFASGDGHLSS